MSEFNVGDEVVYDGTDDCVFIRAGAVGTVCDDHEGYLVADYNNIIEVQFDRADATEEFPGDKVVHQSVLASTLTLVE